MSIIFIGVLACAYFTYASFDWFLEPEEVRAPASIASNYESLSACGKQDVLWKNIKDTEYRTLPDLRLFGMMQLAAMAKQEVSIKGQLHSDFAPRGWRKFLHGRGVVAKVKVVPQGNRLTGLFQGAECALLRLSLTFKPVGGRDVAPGLAFKILRDGVPSANISALVSLEGQKKDYNFFKNSLSNIVPIGEGMGPGMVHRIFLRATDYPEELLAEDMASMDARGTKINAPVAPRQLFFVPGPSLAFSSEEHDFRDDLLKIPAGTVIYQLRVLSPKYQDFDYSAYRAEDAQKFLGDSEHVADIISTSEFTASQFGDDGIFFRHQLRPKSRDKD
jgi:hypothetical protein